MLLVEPRLSRLPGISSLPLGHNYNHSCLLQAHMAATELRLGGERGPLERSIRVQRETGITTGDMIDTTRNQGGLPHSTAHEEITACHPCHHHRLLASCLWIPEVPWQRQSQCRQWVCLFPAQLRYQHWLLRSAKRLLTNDLRHYVGTMIPEGYAPAASSVPLCTLTAL